MIEHGRSTQKEVILNLKIGNLHLHKNGEISFEASNNLEEYEDNEKRKEVREDLSVIDHASAILSQKGGKTFSIKSSFIENLSVKTPSTMYSSTYKRGQSEKSWNGGTQMPDLGPKVQNRIVGWEKYRLRNHKKNNSVLIDPVS